MGDLEKEEKNENQHFLTKRQTKRSSFFVYLKVLKSSALIFRYEFYIIIGRLLSTEREQMRIDNVGIINSEILKVSLPEHCPITWLYIFAYLCSLVYCTACNINFRRKIRSTYIHICIHIRKLSLYCMNLHCYFDNMYF